jgi:hypothetical protein
MYAPVPHDEITTITNYVDQQLAAIRAALLGLTEDQARTTPCRSALSVGGIVKHVAYGMRGAILVIGGTGEQVVPDEAAFADYLASFTLTDQETAEGVVREFDDARRAYLTAMGQADPDADIMAPPAPWHGIYDARPAKLRYYLVHQVEEMARHAGHADILREQLDGLAVPALVMTMEGAAANQFFQPYVPRPGTIGAATAG